MVRPRVPQELPPGSPQGSLKASRLQGSSSKGRPKVSRLARGRSSGTAPAARARGSGPGRAQHLGPEFGAPGPRASGPGLSVLWRCVVSPGAWAWASACQGQGPRLDARRGDGPRARDRGTKCAATVLQSRPRDQALAAVGGCRIHDSGHCRICSGSSCWRGECGYYVRTQLMVESSSENDHNRLIF